MSGDRSRWTVQYMQRVLATDPIGYWMQDEKQGLVSYDMVTARSDGARNGLYTGPTLGQPGIGDGRTSALFDGGNDYDNIFSVSLAGAFNAAEGSMMIWFRVANAGVWTDGNDRAMMTLGVDGNNRVILQKVIANNSIQARYRAGGVNSLVTTGGMTTTAFQNYLITWSKSVDQVIVYLNGIQTGAIQNGLGNWVGALNAARCAIGSLTVPVFAVWSGTLAHGVAWDYALSPAQALSLGVL